MGRVAEMTIVKFLPCGGHPCIQFKLDQTPLGRGCRHCWWKISLIYGSQAAKSQILLQGMLLEPKTATRKADTGLLEETGL